MDRETDKKATGIVGDPDGKRRARQIAEQLEEACRLAECLAKAIRRAGEDDQEVVKISQRLRILATSSLEKAVGRVEPRLKTKLSAGPLLERRLVNSLYLDESGTASLRGNDKVFALGGVAINEEHVDAYTLAANQIKMDFFGTTDITFHEPHMRKSNGPFRFSNQLRQSEF